MVLKQIKHNNEHYYYCLIKMLHSNPMGLDQLNVQLFSNYLIDVNITYKNVLFKKIIKTAEHLRITQLEKYSDCLCESNK